MGSNGGSSSQCRVASGRLYGTPSGAVAVAVAVAVAAAASSYCYRSTLLDS